MAKVGAITGPMYFGSMFFLLATIGLGCAFIVLSMSSRFFKWEVSDCAAHGNPINADTNNTKLILDFNLDMTVDIGWREFMVTYIEPATEAQGCLDDFKSGEIYPIADYQDNSASLAGLGMVASWGAGVLVAFYTLIALLGATRGRRRGWVSLVNLTKWCAVFTIGVVTATTVFWWLIEGKFGKRDESLVTRLFEHVKAGAELCRNDAVQDFCLDASWKMDTPGWALSLGIASMWSYGAATFLLWIISARVDHLNSGEEELDAIEPAKPAVGGGVMADRAPQTPEKARAKDRRSAKTGVKKSPSRPSRAPSSTVEGGYHADAGPDPMTYALEEGRDEELGSADDDDDEEVVYKNHQVHHAVINHSQANPTQGVDSHHQMDSQASRQYSRSYSRGTSNASYVTGGQSFDERSEGDYSDVASSAQYYAGGQGGQSFMSSSSRGESFDEYHHR